MKKILKLSETSTIIKIDTAFDDQLSMLNKFGDQLTGEEYKEGQAYITAFKEGRTPYGYAMADIMKLRTKQGTF